MWTLPPDLWATHRYKLGHALQSEPWLLSSPLAPPNNSAPSGLHGFTHLDICLETRISLQQQPLPCRELCSSGLQCQPGRWAQLGTGFREAPCWEGASLSTSSCSEGCGEGRRRLSPKAWKGQRNQQSIAQGPRVPASNENRYQLERAWRHHQTRALENHFCSLI